MVGKVARKGNTIAHLLAKGNRVSLGHYASRLIVLSTNRISMVVNIYVWHG
jgi:hypothetical protein